MSAAHLHGVMTPSSVGVMTTTKAFAVCPLCKQTVRVVKYEGASQTLHYPVYKLAVHFANGDRCTGGDGERVKPSPGATIDRLPGS